MIISSEKEESKMRSLKILLTSLFVVFCIGYLQLSFAFSFNNEKTKVTQDAVLREMNSYRVQRGLSPLKMDKRISNIAKAHSQLMAEDRIPFGHAGWKERMNVIFQQFQPVYGPSENVAYSFRDAKGIVAGWLKSRPHRKNIEGNYNLTGIGVARDCHGSTYVTQIFLLTK